MTEPSQPSRPPTIRDVAALAGVSKSLVSLVLQADPRVSDSRRQSVEVAIRELGYRPSRRARALSRKRTEMVGVLLNDLRNPWFIELLAGLSATLRSAGLSPILADGHTDRRVGVDSIETLLGLEVDAIVVVGNTEEELRIEAAARQVPIVLAGTREPHLPLVDVVVNDDLAGARAATRHLISLGHQRIAHIGGPGEIGALRLRGFQEAVRAAGLDSERYLETGGFSEAGGYAAARRLLSRPVRPTAILAFNDVAAIGTLSAADDLDLRVPDDLSVVGYDNTHLARIRHISLTSVDNGNFAVGAQAGRFVVERLRNPTIDARLHLVPTALEVRSSTAAPPPH